jgi:hypothetical protein
MQSFLCFCAASVQLHHACDVLISFSSFLVPLSPLFVAFSPSLVCMRISYLLLKIRSQHVRAHGVEASRDAPLVRKIRVRAPCSLQGPDTTRQAHTFSL